MVTKLTSARPIISAAAVEAVRRGLRIALSRAILPGCPAQCANGQPIRRASGLATSGLSRPTPRKMTTAPIATLSSRLPDLAKSPARSSARPITVTTVPNVIRFQLIRGTTAATASSRSAVTGGTRVALTAGAIEASTVTMTPTSRPTMIVRGATTSVVDGRSAPMAPNTALSPIATTMPAPIPTIEASRPTMNASVRTEPSTCRLDAPRQRKSASSLLRWARMIEHLLCGEQVEPGQRGAGQVVGRPEAQDADDREGPRRSLEQDLHLVTDVETLLFRGVRVDRHLGRAGRPGAFPDRGTGLQLRHGAERDAERRRATGGHRLAVRTDELGVPCDLAFRVLYPRNALGFVVALDLGE